MKIGEKIKNAREDLDMTQSQVAELIPMNQSNYSKIERGLQEPSLEQLKRICQILDLNPSFLLGLNEEIRLSQKDLDLLNDIRQPLKIHIKHIEKAGEKWYNKTY